jgi:hypothetical protein
MTIDRKLYATPSYVVRAAPFRAHDLPNHYLLCERVDTDSLQGSWFPLHIKPFLLSAHWFVFSEYVLQDDASAADLREEHHGEAWVSQTSSSTQGFYGFLGLARTMAHLWGG